MKERVELHRSQRSIVWKVTEGSQVSVLKWRRTPDEADLETQVLHLRVCSAVTHPCLSPVSNISPQRTPEGLFLQCSQPYYPTNYEEMLRRGGKIGEDQARDLLIQVNSALHLANRYVKST